MFIMRQSTCKHQPAEWLMTMHWSQKTTFHWVFLTVLLRKFKNSPTSILSARNHFCGIFLNSYKYYQEIFLRCIRQVTEYTSFLRYVWNVLKTPQKRHFFEMYLRLLKDVTKKTSFFRCIWDVLKTSQKRHFFLRSDWDISRTSHAGWVMLTK